MNSPTLDGQLLARLAALYAASTASTPAARLDEALRSEAVDLAKHGAEIAVIVDAFAIADGVAEDVLTAYRQHSTQALDAAATAARQEAARARVDALKAGLDKLAENIDRGVDPAAPEMQAKARELADHLVAIPEAGGARHAIEPYSFGTFAEKLVNFDANQDARAIKPFSGVVTLPPGTLSYLGARTGRGKSLALVNVAREALQAGRAVHFVTLELSAEQVLRRLVLNTYRASPDFRSLAAINFPAWVMNPEGEPRLFGPGLGFLAGCMQGKFRLSSREELAILDRFRAAFDQVAAWVGSGQLTLHDARSASHEDLMQAVRATDAEVELIDYVQKLRRPEGDAPYSRQGELQAISWSLANEAVKLDRVFLAAAQFRRAEKGEPRGVDVFDEGSFREAGDLEQDAHVALGLGWDKAASGGGEPYRFIEILKDREGPGTGRSYWLDFAGAYSWASKAGERHAEDAARKAEPKSRSKKPSQSEAIDRGDL